MGTCTLLYFTITAVIEYLKIFFINYKCISVSGYTETIVLVLTEFHMFNLFCKIVIRGLFHFIQHRKLKSKVTLKIRLGNWGICFSFETITFTTEHWPSPSSFLQQKAKETSKKAKQSTETINLSLWWRCRHVKTNSSSCQQFASSHCVIEIQRPHGSVRMTQFHFIVTFQKCPASRKQQQKNHTATRDLRDQSADTKTVSSRNCRKLSWTHAAFEGMMSSFVCNLPPENPLSSLRHDGGTGQLGCLVQVYLQC